MLSLGRGLGASVSEVDPNGSISGAQATEIANEVLGVRFPLLPGN